MSVGSIPPGARTPPAVWYTQPEMHDRDLTCILGRSWQYAGAATALAAPGASLRVEVAGQPVILIHDPVAGLRGFYSVCQHRGGPLVFRCEKAAFFQCRYHGWTYNADGSLRGTPQFDRDETFDVSRHSLKPVRLVEWQGMLFVCLDDAAPPFQTFVEGVEALVAPLQLGGNRFACRETYPVNCNWKVYVDNYLEAYHLPHVHPEYAKTLDYTNYREEVYPWWSVQRSGFAGEQGYYGELGEGSELFYFMLWPNTMLNVAAGRLQVNQVLPVAHNRCEVIFDYYYSSASDTVIAEDRKVSARIQAEDAEICAAVQKGLESPAYDTGCYSVRRELALAAYHDLIRRAYASHGRAI